MPRKILLRATVMAALASQTVLSYAQTPPSAAETDPVKLGWMVGAPPPAEKQLNFANGTHYKFPQFRYSFSNWRQFVPSNDVWRGDAGPRKLERAERSDIDAVTFTPLGKTEPMTWAQSLDANYTDAIVVLHKGKIVYEKYMGIMSPHQAHMSNSVTKSLFGLLGAMLVHEGLIDEKALVTKYVPELKDSAYGDATVRQVLDMTIGVKYSEVYADPKAEVWDHIRANGVIPWPAGYTGPRTSYGFLQTLKKEGAHGEAFAYKTVNSDVLGWILKRVTGKNVSELFSERIWQKLGAEENAYMLVDPDGVDFAGGGFNATTRDMARMGEMMRLGGQYNGQQIVPKAVVEDILRGGKQSDFEKAGYKTLPGGSYRNMWWVLHNADGAFAARGVHGQTIYIDPKAEMVIARFASFPMAANAW
jgi:CubicO group peptidase (beta-lactamase class C family)